MSVIESARGLRRAWPVGGAGAFGSAAFVCFSVSSATASSLPSPSTRTSAGFASAPWPRITAMKAFFVFGWIARSVTVIAAASVPSSAAIFWSMPGDILRARRAAAGGRAQIERVDRRPLRVGGEQDVVRPERQRPDRLQTPPRYRRTRHAPAPSA